MRYKYKAYAISVPQLKKLLGMPKNPYTFTSEDDWDIVSPFTLELKGGGGGVTITLDDPRSKGDDDISDGLAYVNSRIYKYLSPPVDEELKARIEALLKKSPRSEFLSSLLEQVMGGYDLSERQLEVIKEIEERSSEGNPLFERIQSALKVSPNNSFLKSLLEQTQSGRLLSPKQIAALDRFPTEELSQEKIILQEMLNNAVLSADERDFIKKLLAWGVKGAPEEGLKRIRHILYSQGRRLSGIPDKEVIRSIFGGDSGRTASDALRELEVRIARLENLGLGYDEINLALMGGASREVPLRLSRLFNNLFEAPSNAVTPARIKGELEHLITTSILPKVSRTSFSYPASEISFSNHSPSETETSWEIDFNILIISGKETLRFPASLQVSKRTKEVDLFLV